MILEFTNWLAMECHENDEFIGLHFVRVRLQVGTVKHLFARYQYMFTVPVY